jgi:hypothetical protein
MGDWTKEKRFEPRTREVVGCEAERISGEHSYGDTSANRTNKKTEKGETFSAGGGILLLDGNSNG